MGDEEYFIRGHSRQDAQICCILISSAFMARLSGCYEKTWSFNLLGIEAQDPTGFAKELPDSSAKPMLSPRVLGLDGISLLAPVPCASDLKYTVNFDLEVDDSYRST